MALGAADRQTHESSGHRLNRHDGEFTGIFVVSHDPAASEETQCEYVIGPGIDSGSYPDAGHLSSLIAVPSQLRTDELVIRHVPVDGMDYPVAPEMDPGLGIHPFIDV